ncbi:MAG: TetR family transcriptional regulator [Deltaproteobacteria bacterium]|nr:TetR family transcriptional regulator [Candidatus Zymogenaceae bacterium]
MAKRSLIEDIRRDQIIESAIASFAAYGYAKTTLDQIADVMDVSRGVITYYFKNKDALLTSVLNRILKSIKEAIGERVDAAGSPTERLREYIFASFEHMEKNRIYYEAQLELWSNLDYKREINSKLYKVCLKTVSDLLEAGVNANEFVSVDVPTISSLIQASIDGLMIQWVFNESSVDLEKSRDALWRTIQGFIGA